jgi:hypothetical protein
VKHVEPYTEEWRHQPALYASRVVEALGDEVRDWWQGPCDPRTVTIRLTGEDTLVWDEESGWRRGRYVSGDRDTRTVLADARYLRAGVGNSTAWRPCYRSYRHYRDGFDLALNGYVAYVGA